jgi:hypothetical protein
MTHSTTPGTKSVAGYGGGNGSQKHGPGYPLGRRSLAGATAQDNNPTPAWSGWEVASHGTTPGTKIVAGFGDGGGSGKHGPGYGHRRA